MSRAVMLSIRPEWCQLIASGRKTIEVRKTRPKIEPPFKCYIYCTKDQKPALYNLQNLPETPVIMTAGDFTKAYKAPDTDWAILCNGKVIGEFVCDAILPISIECSDPTALTTHYEVPGTGLSDVEIMEYLGNGVEGYGWHISDLVIYDTPKTLQEFGITMPPQSWRYVEEKI